MNDHFNQLTPTEDEAIAILMEECAEVIQVCAKIQRHGLKSYNPFDPKFTPNTQLLEKELGDLRLAIMRSTEILSLSTTKIAEQFAHKSESIKQYLHHP